MKGFDFAITTDGELIVDEQNHDIAKSTEDDLRIQLAYDRIKSISHIKITKSPSGAGAFREIVDILIKN